MEWMQQHQHLNEAQETPCRWRLRALFALICGSGGEVLEHLRLLEQERKPLLASLGLQAR